MFRMPLGTSRRRKSSKAKPKRLARKKENAIYAYVGERAGRIAREIGRMIREAPLDKGGVVFVYGPQNSGKTEIGCRLDADLDSRRRFTRAQPRLDREDVVEGFFYSRRDGPCCPAISFSTKPEVEKIFDDHDIVVVDYLPFIPYELQSFFLKELDEFVARGGWFVGLGLLHSSQLTEFLLSALVRQRAVREYQLTATCQKCGRRNAIYQQRLVNGLPPNVEDPELLSPSDEVVYEPRCEECHVVYS